MRLFVSYSRGDRSAVGELIEDLEQARLSVWHDQELHGGEPWWENILEQIRSCDVFLLALSKNSLASKPCQAELSYARALGLPILPVLIGPAGNLRTTPVADLQVVDYRERTRHRGMALLGTVQGLGKDRRPLPNPLPTPPAVPFAYLFRLGAAISRAELTPYEQGDFIRQLRECLETEEDESAKEDARELLRALRSRPDVTHRNAYQIDELLGLLSPSKPTLVNPAARAVWLALLWIAVIFFGALSVVGVVEIASGEYRSNSTLSTSVGATGLMLALFTCFGILLIRNLRRRKGSS
jgi:hypothetical protein